MLKHTVDRRFGEPNDAIVYYIAYRFAAFSLK